MAGKSGHRAFGNIETRRNTRTKKVSGYRARYLGPDGQTHPRSFGDKLAAEAWLVEEKRDSSIATSGAHRSRAVPR